VPNQIQSLISRASIVLSVALLAGCGAQSGMYTAPMGMAPGAFDAMHHHTAAPVANKPGNLGGVPTQNQFQTIQVVVTQVLPEDTSGLPHQNFMVKETAPQAGMVLEVNNDEHFGTKVSNLQVGQALTIRGVEYHDPGANGIHWTHHASQPNDAGFIKTADGTIYQ
jgi:hypothetical protein